MKAKVLGSLSLKQILTDNSSFRDSLLYRLGAYFADNGILIPRRNLVFAAGIKKSRNERVSDLKGFLVLLRGYFDTASSKMFSEALNDVPEESFLRTQYLNNAIEAMLSARDHCPDYKGSIKRINEKLLNIADYANPALGIFAERALRESRISTGDLANILFRAYSSVNVRDRMVPTANLFLHHPGFEVLYTKPPHDYEVISQFYLASGSLSEEEARSVVRAMKSSVIIEQKNLGRQLAPLEERSHESGTLANRVFEHLRQAPEIYRAIEVEFNVLVRGMTRDIALKSATPVEAIGAFS